MPRVQQSEFSDLLWLKDVHEVVKPLSAHNPIWVRHENMRSGPPLPRPTVPHPERHPFCEFGMVSEGSGLQFVEREKAVRKGGSLLMLGPGIPHYGIRLSYPARAAVAYFLPSLLFEIGPNRDGARILSRFTAPQSLRRRLIQLPRGLRNDVWQGFEAMIREFDHPQFGSEARLRALLVQMLVEVLRWEERQGRRIPAVSVATAWKPVELALRYLQKHHTEAIYADRLAAAAGISESVLRELFQKAMGMPWVQYLQSYRIHQAMILLSQPGQRITETAYKVGFGTLSHFTTAFHHATGLSPRDYAKKVLRNTRQLAPASREAAKARRTSRHTPRIKAGN